MLFPCPGYCKQCCNEHWGTRVSFPSGFLSVYAQSEWLRSKSLQVINAGEGVEKREPSYTVGGMQTSTATMENTVEIP